MSSTAAINKILNRSHINILMYGYVSAVKRNFPTVSTREAISQFIAEYKLEATDIDPESLRVQYQSINKDFLTGGQ